MIHLARRILLIGLASVVVLPSIGFAPGRASVARDAWTAPPTWISGTGRYAGGEWVWQDFVYDDGRAAGNAADIVHVRVRLDEGVLRMQVTLNSLTDADSPVIGVGLGSATSRLRAWPLGAGVSSRWDALLTVTPTGVLLTTDSDPVAAGVPAVDTTANTVTFDVPLAWPGASVVLSVGTGVWDAQAPGWSGRPIDLAFNSHAQEGTRSDFRDEAQATAIESGDVSAMSVAVDLERLESGAQDDPILAAGVYNRVFRSRQALGEGFGPQPPDLSGAQPPLYRGLYQPYAVWVPHGYDPQRPAPLTLVLHSLGQVHNQYDTWDLYRDLGDDLGALAVTPLALGPAGWYWDEALVDTLEAWRDAEAHYSVDRDRVYATGYSMGGYATYRLATLLPGLIAGAVSWVGPPAHALWAYPAEPVPNDARAQPGKTYDQLENLQHVPLMIVHGTNDELVPVSGVAHTAERLHELGYAHRFDLHAGRDHFSFAVLDDWTRERAWLDGRERPAAPARVRFKVRPASWATSTLAPDVRSRILDDLFAVTEELGARPDSAYWVRGVQVSAGDGEETGYVDLVSHAIARREPVTADVTGLHAGSSPHVQRFATRRLAAGDLENVLAGTLTNVDELTVDLRAAGLEMDGLIVDVDVDRPVRIHLVDGDDRHTMSI